MTRPLYGRDRELALTCETLRDEPGALVTLLGPPGVGKTALALAALDDGGTRRAFPGGLYRVSLGGARGGDAPAVRARVADALGAPALTTGDDPVAAWLASAGRALVLLDECEGACEAAAEALARWRAVAADVAWLVTSRRALGLQGERVIALGGIDPASANELIVARACAARPGWSPEADERSLLARVAQALDGMPLALELAAAQVATRSLVSVAEQLSARSLELTGGADVPARHRSLYVAVRSSLDDLAPEATDDLAALATLRAPFDLAAAAAVTGRDADAVREVIAAMELRSLAHAPAAGRHRLFAAVREVALEHLDEARRAVVAARHAEHFARISARETRAVLDGDAKAGRDALRAVLDDLFAAAGGDPPLALQLTLLAGIDAALMGHGGSEALDALLARAVARAEREGDGTSLVRAKTLRGRGAYLRGRVSEACEDLTSARAVSGADELARAECMAAESAARRGLGQNGEALRVARESLALAEAIGDARVALRAMQQEACALTMQGALDAAREVFLRTLARAREHGARRVEGLCLSNLGVVAVRAGDRDVARLRVEQGVAAFDDAGDVLMAAKLRSGLAWMRVEAGDIDGAEVTVALALASARATRDRQTELECVLTRARCDLARGRRAEARVAIEDVLASARALGLDELTRDAEALCDKTLFKRETRALRIGAGAYWFELDGGPRVELGRRPNLRRVLAKLVALRAERRDAVVTVGDLVEAGWPGERVLPEAGAERVYTAVRTLRAMGLRDVLVRRDGGYALDPAVALIEG